jgi:GTPase SAR1 family protein
MSFNLKKIGRPFAKIDSGKDKDKIVSIDDNETDEGFNKMKLKDGKFEQIPSTSQERDILYITGPSGSGKSYYTSRYIKNYKKAHKDHPVYLFSPVPDDKKLDDLKVKRVKIDDSLISDPIKPSDLKESLVIFDDIDCITQKGLRDALYNLLNQILEVGRHTKTSCVITNHLPTNGKDTRRILNESHSITYFPASGSKRQINNLLENYIGMDTKDIKKAKNLGSRWVTIFKNYPQFVMTEKDIYLLNSDE